MSSAAIDRPPPDQLRTITNTAGQLDVNPATLRRWGRYGTGPKFIRMSRRVIRYRQSDIDAFLNQSTSDQR